MARVLCTGIDAMLLQTRKLILESAGHEVITVMDEQSLVALCKEECFDVAVIGQTVTSKIKRRVSALVREHCPESRILELYQPHIGRSLEDADSWLVVPADIPMQLTERVNELSAKRS